MDVYVEQVLKNRMAAGKLPTRLAIGLDGDPGVAPWVSKVVSRLQRDADQGGLEGASPDRGETPLGRS